MNRIVSACLLVIAVFFCMTEAVHAQSQAGYFFCRDRSGYGGAFTPADVCPSVAAFLQTAPPADHCYTRSAYSPFMPPYGIDNYGGSSVVVLGACFTEWQTSSLTNPQCQDTPFFAAANSVGCICHAGAPRVNGTCRCLDGQGWDDNTKQCVAYTPDDMRGVSCPSCGNNPINPAFGNEFKEEVDFVGVGAFPLEFRRYYNSNPVVLLREGKPLGSLWRHNYSRSVALITGRTSGYSAGVYRPDGKIHWFSASALLGPYTGGRPHITGTLTPTSSGGNVTGWVYVSAEGDLSESYNAMGNLTTITNRAGLTQTIAYDAYNRMASVTDAFGRAMTFAYDTKFRIVSITRPGGSVYQYAYENVKNNLVSVTYPGSQIRQYVYEDTNFANALTGIIDENTQRYLTLGYDTQGRATSSTLAGGAESITVTYNVDGTATSTDALGAVRTYSFTNINSVLRNTSITGSLCPTCGPALQTFDANGFPASAVDWNNNRTNYLRTDPQGRNDLETSRTEGLTSGGG